MVCVRKSWCDVGWQMAEECLRILSVLTLQVILVVEHATVTNVCPPPLTMGQTYFASSVIDLVSKFPDE